MDHDGALWTLEGPCGPQRSPVDPRKGPVDPQRSPMDPQKGPLAPSGFLWPLLPQRETLNSPCLHEGVEDGLALGVVLVPVEPLELPRGQDRGLPVHLGRALITQILVHLALIHLMFLTHLGPFNPPWIREQTISVKLV